MAWQNAAFQFPSIAKALSDSVDDVLTQGRGEIDTALSRLGRVSPQFVNNPTAATAEESAAAQNNLAALFDADLRLLVVHPYQEGVGQGSGYSRHLSAPNAQLALADKLGDTWDSYTPAGDLEALAVLFAEQTLESFASRLAAIGQVFPVPELRMAERRADQLLRLEAEKSVLPGAPLGGNWRPRHLLQLQAARIAAGSVGTEIASAYGYALENIDPLTELQSLAAKKQTHLDAVRAETENLVAQFAAAGPTWCLSATGSPREIAEQIKEVGPYDHDHVFSAALLFVAAPGALTVLREMFGL
ncbi:hypothetical protein [Microbulbifer thermotolerans]|uniref:hypothetical protein n=1 Tax=Microbulbifer thermotolerans TaxID=252514 RepID=UPI00224B7003|nr:hypothetical protein [Microbulbifer thermotolerans]MCX2834447.1 hypothetical protein [Microbulbifer thermotolerans]